MTDEQKRILLQLLNAGTQAMGLGAFEGDNAQSISDAIKAFRDISTTDKAEEITEEATSDS